MPDDMKALNNLAAICVQNNEYEEALKYYFMMLKQTPGDDNITGNIGALYQRLKNYPKAIEYDKKALVLNPRNITACDNLIGICSVTGDTANLRKYRELRAKYSSQ
jgi:tetratricopeptide (TPR) repeat protein